MGNIDTTKVQEHIDQMTDSTEKNEAQEALKNFIDQTKNEVDNLKKEAAERLLISALQKKGIETSQFVASTQENLNNLSAETQGLRPQKTTEEMEKERIKAEETEKIKIQKAQEAIKNKIIQNSTDIRSLEAADIHDRQIVERDGEYYIQINRTEDNARKWKRYTRKQKREQKVINRQLRKAAKYAKKTNEYIEESFSNQAGVIATANIINGHKLIPTGEKVVTVFNTTPGYPRTSKQENGYGYSPETQQQQQKEQKEYNDACATNATRAKKAIDEVINKQERIGGKGKRILRNTSEVVTKLGPVIMMGIGIFKLAKGIFSSKDRAKNLGRGAALLAGGFGAKYTDVMKLFDGDDEESAKEEGEKATEKIKEKTRSNRKPRPWIKEEIRNPAVATSALKHFSFGELYDYMSFDNKGEIIGFRDTKGLEEIIEKRDIPEKEKEQILEHVKSRSNRPEHAAIIIKGLQKLGINRKIMSDNIDNQAQGHIFHRWKQYENKIIREEKEAEKESLGAQDPSKELMESMIAKAKNIQEYKNNNGVIEIKINGERKSPMESAAYLLGDAVGKGRVLGEKIITNTINGTKLFIGNFWEGIAARSQESIVVQTAQDVQEAVKSKIQQGRKIVTDGTEAFFVKAGETAISFKNAIFEGRTAYIVGHGLVEGAEALGTGIIDLGSNAIEFVRNNISEFFTGATDAATNGK